MNFAYRTTARTLVCASLLLGTATLTLAQTPSNGQASADNSKINQRDQNANEPTADQQKDNRSDLDITRQIRKSIVADKSLSTYAHNVKIITQNGQVTLKGPVGSNDEKRAVASMAAAVVGESKVTDNLSIKSQQ
jgi:hyperosmotically inducible protein